MKAWTREQRRTLDDYRESLNEVDSIETLGSMAKEIKSLRARTYGQIDQLQAKAKTYQRMTHMVQSRINAVKTAQSEETEL